MDKQQNKVIMEDKKSVFEVLNAINCNEHVEKKNGLNYLSWAWAWSIVKKHYPLAEYKVYERGDTGIPYFTDGKTCWVKTEVTIEGLPHMEYLPIMDHKNNSIPLERVTSMDMNKAIQRSLTKCCARHGLGLYIYASEDLPEQTAAQPAPPQPQQFNPEPMETPSLESQNVDNLFGGDMPDNTMDGLETRIAACKDLDTLKAIWNDAIVLLDKRPADFEIIKRKVAIASTKFSEQ